MYYVTFNIGIHNYKKLIAYVLCTDAGGQDASYANLYQVLHLTHLRYEILPLA